MSFLATKEMGAHPLTQSTSRPPPWALARATPVQRRANAIGWLSVGLGLAQLIAPRQVARWIGVEEDDDTALALRAVGLRELTCGVGLLSQSHSAAWAWARVAGDVMDLALLASAPRRNGAERTLSAAAGVFGAALLDAQTALQLGREPDLTQKGVVVLQSITINRSPEDVYSFFRDLENLPRFMTHLVYVRVSNGRSHWRAKGPLGTSVEWDAEIIQDRPGELLAWRSLADADIPNSGRVTFRPAPGGRGTELVVHLNYDPPAGALGVLAAQIFQSEPAQEIASDLRRLKQVLETGEVMHSDASIHAGLHAARPPGMLEADDLDMPETDPLGAQLPVVPV
ncbi:MAG: hypothetical protein RL033_114 [Pseudomonadota bacterium]